MSSFAALMALSATQTRQAEEAVQSALDERRRKEAQRRKEQEERERKERELEAKLRMKRFEDEKREQERQQRLQQELAAKERKFQQREEQERDRLRYGPKKAPARTDKSGYPVSNAALRHSRTSDDESSSALTREEKRKRRQEAELRYGVNASRRVGHSSSYGKAGRRLPGGAMDITTTNTTLSDPGSSLSVRQRLAAEPAMLIRLNVNKRDTRTIDEIMQDRAKAKTGAVLQGDQAKEFNDWFGKNKQKDVARITSSQTGSASTSRANTPATGSQPPPKVASGSASPATRPSSQLKSIATPAKPSASQRAVIPKATPSKLAPNSSVKPQGSLNKASAVSSKLAASATRPAIKKRPRSPSRSPSPPPRKRAMSSGPSHNDISQEIWKLFGKDRSRYVAADVMSDDEDMEAGARDLEKEELRSSRIARKEEELALEEERRHEEEKRRKRKERDRDTRKGL
ncbi:uncharacterized protein FIBRA_07190 [Fibroporia radiculosa]|uniref:SPT2 chromatin protein n=1 Tax=Fibroporia radiculosa TaxID=599839 RepID=J4I0A6_9APHY|nr:uncharacterized protein FIBRA_07190 [Fibroporia radiculosa]CCM04992.1 predicted protein [Fibroporia radiculosa]